ncbi:MAG: MerR family transcriptional regulator [Verrucomicrobiota bacterium]|nr:MerR family transcriptional regulator [Verrucomicrobiota bacterium]
MNKPIRTMKFVARQTGLSMHTIRIWEKRYRAVEPVRAPNNRRLYSEEDVERLRLLREATGAGHAISQVARASLAELRALVREAAAPTPLARAKRTAQRTKAADSLLESAFVAIADFDGPAFTKLLDRGAVELGSPAVLQKFIAPLVTRVGDLWREGEFGIAHEHFASNHITEFLSSFARPYSDNATAPHLVLATPTGQLHELGAIIVAAAARSHGWRTTYLGAALPVEELAGALRNLQPRALGLSIVFPPDDAALARDLRKLKTLLPRDCAFIVGGRSAADYGGLLRELKAIRVGNLEELYPILDALHREKPKRLTPRAK